METILDLFFIFNKIVCFKSKMDERKEKELYEKRERETLKKRKE
jgi:hypothetical protein